MRFKKCIISLALCTLSFLCIGCGSLKIQSNTSINEDGSGEFVVRQVAQGAYKQIINKDGKEDFFGTEYKNGKLNAKEEKDKIVHEIKVPFKSIAELNGIFKTATQSNIKIILSEDKGIFKNKYSYKLDLPDIFTADEVMKAVEEYAQSGMFGQQQFSPEETREFIGKSITFENSLKVPGKILASNATTVNGNIATWSAPLAKINPKGHLKLTYEVTNKLGMCLIAGGIVVIVLISTIIFSIIRKKKKINLMTSHEEETPVL